MRIDNTLIQSRRGVLLGAGAVLLTAHVAAQDAPPAKPAPAAPAAPATPQLPKPRTIILVRHAEKVIDDSPDPALSDAGKARSALLAKMLSQAGVTHIITSEFKRAKDTAEPLATALSLKPTPHPARDAMGLAGRLTGLPDGSIALVVGHSNTLPMIAKSCGVTLKGLKDESNLRDDEYDRMVILTVYSPDTKSRSVADLELRY